MGVHGRQASTRATAPQGPAPGPQSAARHLHGTDADPDRGPLPALAWGAWTDDPLLERVRAEPHGAPPTDRLVLTLGLGYGENTVADGPARPSGLLPNLGVVWNAGSRLALYASYAVSYSPADPSAEDAAGSANVFDADARPNYEAGAK